MPKVFAKDVKINIIEYGTSLPVKSLRATIAEIVDALRSKIKI